MEAKTGKLKWHFQFTPNDAYDYDAVQIPVLADLQWNGARVKAMLWANRNGYFYVLDRETGKFLLGRPFVKVNWSSGLDQRGRPRVCEMEDEGEQHAADQGAEPDRRDHRTTPRLLESSWLRTVVTKRASSGSGCCPGRVRNGATGC